MEDQATFEHSSAPRTPQRRIFDLARIIAAVLLVAGFSLFGSQAQADVTDPLGHQFHTFIVCDPYTHHTTINAYRMDTPAYAILTLRNIQTGVVLDSPIQGPTEVGVAGNIDYDWNWVAPGAEAMYGESTVWITYIWAEGSRVSEPVYDIRLYGDSDGVRQPFCEL